MLREYIIKINENDLVDSGGSKRIEKMDELIRCKDCKHGSLYCTEDVCGETLIECNRPDLGDTIEIHGWGWFCADGERKEGR